MSRFAKAAFFAAAFALPAALSRAPAGAQQSAFAPVGQKPVIGACASCLKKFTPDDIVALLKDEGYGGVRKSAKTPGLVFFKADGRLMGLGTNKSGTLTYIYAHGRKPLPLKAVNLWNRKSSFSKAIVAPNGANLLRVVLIGGTGVPRRKVIAMTKTFATYLVPRFVKFHDKALNIK